MPNFTVSSSEYTVADYCKKIDKKELVVNKDYQRGESVWPDAARSFLIESILLGYPIPKISIRSTTDLKTKETREEIVDGQQRTWAIHDYYHNKFAISKGSEVDAARGRVYDDLDEEMQIAFISFRLQVDVFVGASAEDIRELFRRMNSYTVTLNHEEKRHARYQGRMKWFVYKIARLAAPTFERFGVLTEKQLARMQDAKLIADIIYACEHGIQTTKPSDLNNLYKEHDSQFPGGAGMKDRFERVLTLVNSLPDLANEEICRSYNFYSLVLALTHLQKPIEKLNAVWDATGKKMKKGHDLLCALVELSEILERDELEVAKVYRPFWKASDSKTNTREHRETRFKFICRAICTN